MALRAKVLRDGQIRDIFPALNQWLPIVREGRGFLQLNGDVPRCVAITVGCRTAFAARPLSYSKTFQAFRASALATAAAGLG